MLSRSDLKLWVLGLGKIASLGSTLTWFVFSGPTLEMLGCARIARDWSYTNIHDPIK